MTPLLEIRALTRDYGAAGGPVFRALDSVSLSLGAGEILGVVGESGSGKSTLARLAMALDRPTSGEVLLEGESLFKLSPGLLRRRRRDFQMVFQDPYGSLDPRWRVGRVVAEPLGLLGGLSRRERAERAAEMLEQVGLSADSAEKYPHEFSGGQRQRIAIARALVTTPKLLVADEAVSALDLSVQAQILRLLLNLRERFGLAILFITHNIGVVDEICDRMAVLDQGRLVEIGATRAVLAHPQAEATRRLLAAEPNLAVLGRKAHRALRGETP